MSEMVSPRGLLLILALPALLWADVRYTLKCDIESNDKVMLKSGAMVAAMKDCSSTILQTATRQLTKTSRMTQIVEFGSESIITIDHEKKTWMRHDAAQTEQAAQASLRQLQQMGAVFQLSSHAIERPRVIAGYEAKGIQNVLTMTFQFPGMPQGMNSRSQMEMWFSETAPGAKEIIAAIGSNTDNSPTMRMMRQFLATFPGGDQVIKETRNLRGQLLEMSIHMETHGLAEPLNLKMTMRAEGFDTTPIPASEFDVPEGYKEVK